MSNRIDYLDYTFENVKIASATLSLEEALDMRSLGTDTLEATVKCLDENIVNFAQNAPLTYYHNGSQAGVFYVQGVTRVGSDRYAISAYSSVGRLTQRRHYGGIYTGQTAAAVIADICGSIPYSLQANLSGIAVYGWLPIASARDNLAQVLFAINANLRTGSDGVLRIGSLEESTSGSIDDDHIYLEDASVDYDAPVTSVTVIDHQYAAGVDETTLFEGAAEAGQLITFSNPMSSLTADGFSVTESGANYARLSAGIGTLIGRPYIHTTREITRSVTAAEIPNEVRVEDATLVSLTNSATVADRLAEYYSHRETIRASAIVNYEKPGDVVSIYHPYRREMVNACIAKSSVNVSNTLKSQLQALVGFVPYQTAPFSDVRELLTGSGVWTVPDGVTEVTAVLIGRGSDGTAGSPGGSVVRDFVNRTNSAAGPAHEVTVSLSASARSVSAASGGVGGIGGSGGNIFRVDLEVKPGQTFSFSCGTSADVNSKLGSYTSAQGGTIATGYYDPVSHQSFGVAGQTGGTGGSGGGVGSPGESTLNASGGAGREGRTITDGDTRESSTNVGTTSATMSMGGAGGGGAGGTSNGTAGSPGMPAEYRVPDKSGYNVDAGATNGIVRVYGIKPGSGGAGANGPDGTNYGNGGAGGGGGGGCGAMDAISVTATHTHSTKYSDRTVAEARVQIVIYSTSEAQCVGGAGGSGGRGANGCIILYYRKSEE